MPADDSQLITWEVDAIFGLNLKPNALRHAPLDPGPKAVFGWSSHDRVIALDTEDGIDFTDSPQGRNQTYVPAVIPDTVKELRAAILAGSPHSPLVVEGGPSFLLPDSRPANTDLPDGIRLICSAETALHDGYSLIRPGNWQREEWRDLIEGRIGKWAMAIRQNQPVAICFTPAANDKVAEAGVWTRPDQRGRGLASAVTWAWAECERPSGRALLYSTSSKNAESQAVARKMGLMSFGWIWTLT